MEKNGRAVRLSSYIYMIRFRLQPFPCLAANDIGQGSTSNGTFVNVVVPVCFLQVWCLGGAGVAGAEDLH